MKKIGRKVLDIGFVFMGAIFAFCAYEDTGKAWVGGSLFLAFAMLHEILYRGHES